VATEKLEQVDQYEVPVPPETEGGTVPEKSNKKKKSSKKSSKKKLPWSKKRSVADDT
jgi:hypothetical protein